MVMKRQANIRHAAVTARSIRSRQQHRCSQRRLTRAIVEGMESRVMLSFTVTSLADGYQNGVLIPNTLRWAIGQATSHPGYQTIVFDSSLTNGGAATINLILGTNSALTINKTNG